MGAGAFAALAQVIVHMPAGYFGGGGAGTTFGYAFASLQLLLFTAYFWTRLHNRRLVYAVAGSLLLMNTGVFVLALVSDPVLAGSVVLWHVSLLSRIFFPTAPLAQRAREDELAAWLATNGPAVRHLLLVSLAATTAIIGYQISDQPFALLICLALGAIAASVSFPLLMHLWRQGSRGARRSGTPSSCRSAPSAIPASPCTATT